VSQTIVLPPEAMDEDPFPRPSGILAPRGAFPSTQWSMVLHAGAGSESLARTALESLCRQYWYPLYTFVRRQGRSHHEAEDCTQEFLARLLASEAVARAKPERGRFRTFLLASLRNFLVNEWQRGQAVKRGGGLAPLPLEFDTAGDRFAREPVDPGLTPEQAFDRNYALDLIVRTLAALRDEYEQSDRGALFGALRPLLWGNSSPEKSADQAARLGISAHAFTMALQRLRRRLGERLRTEVRQTVDGEAEVETELRHLIAASGGAAS
jgi:DNA-directed RNA polymerase specialized sigma24 family protein